MAAYFIFDISIKKYQVNMIQKMKLHYDPRFKKESKIKNFFRKFFLSNQIVKKIKRLEEENKNLKKYITQTKYQKLVSKKKT